MRTQGHLIHFVGGKLKTDEERFTSINMILETQQFVSRLEEELFGENYYHGEGWGRSAMPICFTDLPEQLLQSHNKHYSKFGIAFSKKYIVTNGGNPVFYWAEECEILKKASNHLSQYMADLEKTISQCCDSKLPLEAMSDLYELIWPIMQLSKPFKVLNNSSVYDEQEWRILGESGKWKFDRNEVKFVTAPIKYLNQLKQKWPNIEIKAL
jgi:hypothetical protein